MASSTGLEDLGPASRDPQIVNEDNGKPFTLAEAAPTVVDGLRESLVADVMESGGLPESVRPDDISVIIKKLLDAVENTLVNKLGGDFVAIEEYQKVVGELAVAKQQHEAVSRLSAMKRTRDIAGIVSIDDEGENADGNPTSAKSPKGAAGASTDIDMTTRMKLLSARRPWLHLDWWTKTPLTPEVIRAVMQGFHEYVDKAAGPEKYALETAVKTVQAHLESCAEKGAAARPDMAVVRPLYDRVYVTYQAEVGLVGKTSKGARAAALAAGASKLADNVEGVPEEYKDVRKIMSETAAAVSLGSGMAQARNLAALPGGAGAYGLQSPPGAPRGGRGGRPRPFRGTCRNCGAYGHMAWQCAGGQSSGHADGPHHGGGRGDGPAGRRRGGGGTRGGGGGAADGTTN